MSKTLVAIYDDITVARQVIEDLVAAGFDRSSISLVMNDAQNQYVHYLDEHYTAREDAVTASEGAGFGAVVGGLTGILLGLAALTIPGIGLAIVAGPVVAGLTGLLAGAVTGGVVGALVKSGVPQDDAPYYAEGIRRGGTLISIETDDTLRADDILHRHGSINIHERSNVWRQAGWQGFDADVEMTEPASALKETPHTPSVMSHNEQPHERVVVSEPASALKETPHTPSVMSHNEQPHERVVAAEPPQMPNTFKSFTVVVPPTDPVDMPMADVGVMGPVADEDVLMHRRELSSLEEDLNRPYEYTDDDFQRIEPFTPHPKE